MVLHEGRVPSKPLRHRQALGAEEQIGQSEYAMSTAPGREYSRRFLERMPVRSILIEVSGECRAWLEMSNSKPCSTALYHSQGACPSARSRNSIDRAPLSRWRIEDLGGELLSRNVEGRRDIHRRLCATKRAEIGSSAMRYESTQQR